MAKCPRNATEMQTIQRPSSGWLRVRRLGGRINVQFNSAVNPSSSSALTRIVVDSILGLKLLLLRDLQHLLRPLFRAFINSLLQLCPRAPSCRHSKLLFYSTATFVLVLRRSLRSIAGYYFGRNCTSATHRHRVASPPALVKLHSFPRSSRV